MRDARLKADFTLIITTIIIFLSFAQQEILIVASRGYSLMRRPSVLRIMSKLWRNSRERRQGIEKRQGEDSSDPKGVEVLLRETVRKGYPVPEDVDNPMIAHRDYNVLRQSERVLEFQNRDLWIRPTDLSWHFPIKKLPLKVTREVESQRGQDRGTQEAEDSEK